MKQLLLELSKDNQLRNSECYQFVYTGNMALPIEYEEALIKFIYQGFFQKSLLPEKTDIFLVSIKDVIVEFRVVLPDVKVLDPDASLRYFGPTRIRIEIYKIQ